MFGGSGAEQQPVALLARETRAIAQINREAYDWLGKRYAWYNKIRNAKKEGLALFRERGLEEQMEATRSALSLVNKTLQSGLMLAHNGVVDSVQNAGQAPEGWPEKLQAGPNGEPPVIGDEQDALIIAWSPLKFLNLAKAIRDKGKGLDYYAEGLVKKLYFKVLAYYCDNGHWATERQGYLLLDLEADAPLQDVQNRLAPLKQEAELFAASYQPFRFGGSQRRQDESTKNTLDEAVPLSDDDLLRELYFQSLLASGMEHFIFRYYLTLLSATANPRAYKYLSQIFQPVMARAAEVHLRFMASFGMERDKQRLRTGYTEYFKRMEARPVVETTKERGREVRRVNYGHKLMEAMSFARSESPSAKQAENWRAFLGRFVAPYMDDGRGAALLLELLNGMLVATRSSVDARVKVAGVLRQFADEQEKYATAQLTQKRRALEEEKRKKNKEKARFRSLEQDHMVATVEQEIADMDAKGNAELEQMQDQIAARRQAHISRVEKMEAAAREEGQSRLGANAGTLYRLAVEAEPEGKLHGALVSYLLRFVQEDPDDHYDLLYRNLFKVVPDLAPTEKMVLRSAVGRKLELAEDELAISQEDQEAYGQQVKACRDQLNQAQPGAMDMRLTQGPVNARLEELLGVGMTSASLRAVLQLPMQGNGQQPGRLPGAAVKQALILNQLLHPMADVDLLLPNTEETTPVLKRINFNRLQKAIK